MCYTYDNPSRVTKRTVKSISTTGTTNVILGYNGRDGVITDKNGLIYMRARYYSPAMRRFVNADIVAGEISNAITLNRFAYANGNPVSFVDPFGLAAINPVFQMNLKDTQSGYTYKPRKRTRQINSRVVSAEDSEIFWWDYLRVDGNTFALYDNDRLEDIHPWHEQLFVLTLPKNLFEYNVKEGIYKIGGAIEADLITGGWEWENFDLSLLDFGHVELSAEVSAEKGLEYGALASFWSPSITLSIGKIDIELGFEIGAIGARSKATKDGISYSFACGLGGMIDISWD